MPDTSTGRGLDRREGWAVSTDGSGVIGAIVNINNDLCTAACQVHYALFPAVRSIIVPLVLFDGVRDSRESRDVIGPLCCAKAETTRAGWGDLRITYGMRKAPPTLKHILATPPHSTRWKV